MKTPYLRRDRWPLALCFLLIGMNGVTYVLSDAGKAAALFGMGFFALCCVVLLFGRHLRRHTDFPRQSEKVTFDEQEIRRHLVDGCIETIAWNDIDEISIVTTDQGPWADDVFWFFISRDRSSGCVVSNQAAGFKDLLPRIQCLPGFDNHAVVSAMASAVSQRFIAWKSPTMDRTIEAPHEGS
jgi:hypothetical protein